MHRGLCLVWLMSMLLVGTVAVLLLRAEPSRIERSCPQEWSTQEARAPEAQAEGSVITAERVAEVASDILDPSAIAVANNGVGDSERIGDGGKTSADENTRSDHIVEKRVVELASLLASGRQ
jgi:hypothetical protein